MIEPKARRVTIESLLIVLGTLATIVSVPYLFSAPLSISRSYVAGFSNRAAILILFLGIALLTIARRAHIARIRASDSRLTWRSLAVASSLIFISGIARCGHHLTRLPGTEAVYFLNRLQMLAAGQLPYKQFEFVYGPLLLYPVWWAQRLFHLSSIQAYSLTWLCYWQIGVVLIWVAVRKIDFPIPSRVLVFSFLLAIQWVWAAYGGLSYSPFRAYFAVFAIVVVHRLWVQTQIAWLVAVCSVAAVTFAMMCSMDQAIGVTVGLFAMLILLAISADTRLGWGSVALYVLGVGACFVLADKIGLTLPLRSFGGGGYSYPLLPSLPIFAALFAYMVAGCAVCCVLYDSVIRSRKKDEKNVPNLSTSVLVPLTVAGCSMIPNALGRCDVLHISAATPALLVGVGLIAAMPGVWRWWFPAAVLGLIIFPMGIGEVSRHVKVPLPVLSDNQWYESESSLAASELPCDQQYFSPSYMPDPRHKFLPNCLDTGYFVGFTDVITPQTIAYKIEELKQHRTKPLLMENIPLDAQLPPQLTTMNTLYFESETWWVPPARHAPLTYAPIIDYIRRHYVEGPVIHAGELRIWYPAAK